MHVLEQDRQPLESAAAAAEAAAAAPSRLHTRTACRVIILGHRKLCYDTI